MDVVDYYDKRALVKTANDASLRYVKDPLDKLARIGLWNHLINNKVDLQKIFINHNLSAESYGCQISV
jgi:hypothetical protein